MTTVNLLTSVADLDALHAVADSKAATVRVNRQALLNLLIDHGALYKAAHAASGVRLTEPAQGRKRPQLAR